MTWVLIGLSGALGALARYRVTGIVHRHTETVFPVGTLVVNLSGAFAAGLLGGLASSRGVPNLVYIALGVGFLGGYTTFSTWMVETLLIERSGGRIGVRRGIQNLVVTVALGIVLAAVGYALGRWI